MLGHRVGRTLRDEPARGLEASARARTSWLDRAWTRSPVAPMPTRGTPPEASGRLDGALSGALGRPVGSTRQLSGSTESEGEKAWPPAASQIARLSRSPPRRIGRFD